MIIQHFITASVSDIETDILNRYAFIILYMTFIEMLVLYELTLGQAFIYEFSSILDKLDLMSIYIHAN